MEEKLNEIRVLRYNLGDSWFSMIPIYLKIYSWDIFDIDYDIFEQIEFIVGRRKY